MDANKIDLFMTANNSLFPAEKLAIIREKLLTISDLKWSIISTTRFLSPTKAFVFSILFGSLAVDRFYIGGNAWLKLLTCGGLGILTIKDWFTITNETREQNYKKLQELLF